MTTAVHGKASLTDVLGTDSASKGNDLHDDRDKTNTVDFGATLTTLIDRANSSVAPALAATHSEPASVKRSAGGFDSQRAAILDSSADGAANTPEAKLSLSNSKLSDKTTQLDPNLADALDTSHPSSSRATLVSARSSAPIDRHLFTEATSSELASESGATPTTEVASSHSLTTRGESLKALADQKTLPVSIENVAADKATSGQLNTGSRDSAGTSSLSVVDDQVASAPSSKVATIDSGIGQSAAPAAEAKSDAGAATVSPVPDTDIALDEQRQSSSSTATDGPPPLSSARGAMLAKDDTRTNSPTPIDQNAAIQPPTPTYRTDISHSRSERSNNGTSPALSTQSANWDSMKPGDTNTTQSTFTDLSANATTASGLPSSQEQMDAPTPTLEEQRTRITTSKETSSQQSATSTVLSGSPRSTNVQAASRAPEVTAIRLTPEVASVRDASRTVNITVELASGQTAQASVRERAGSVDVKIVTPTAASAQRVSSEMEGARQNLDAAGIKLGHSDISYQRGDGGRRENEGYRPPAQAQSASEKEVFIMNEVVQ